MITNRRTRPLVPMAAAVLVASLALAGCGREEPSEDDPGAAPSEVAEGAAEGTITVWAMGTEGEELDAIAEGFMDENPDAVVEVTPVPWDAAHDKIATAIASGETPDVSLIGTTWMGEFARTGALDPTPTDLIDESAFFEGPWSTTVVDDTSYGVPWYTETRVLYYRTDLAEQAGITEPPTNWDELKTLAEGVQQAGAQWGLYLQPGENGAWQTFMPFAWQNGVELVEGEEFTLDTPEMVEALEFYNSFYTEGLTPTEADPAIEASFVDNKVGAFFSGPWHMSLIRDAGGVDGTWTVAPMPAEDSGTSFVGGGDLVVFKDAENREGGWKFVEYLTRPEVQQEFYGLVSALPTNSAAWESGELAEDAMLAVFGDQLEDAKSPPTIPTWEQVASVIDAEIEKVVKAGLPPADAASAIQSGAESIGSGT